MSKVKKRPLPIRLRAALRVIRGLPAGPYTTQSRGFVSKRERQLRKQILALEKVIADRNRRIASLKAVLPGGEMNGRARWLLAQFDAAHPGERQSGQWPTSI